MSKFNETIKLLKRHYPKNINGDEPIIINLANMISMSGIDEEQVIEFCDQLSDEFDNSFERGINQNNL